MYIYEGHMGGLYCTDEQMDWDFLYCEDCGDSDFEIGFAKNIETAWTLLKPMTSTFDESLCENCPHNGDYDYCDEHCEEFSHSGGYNVGYIMKFLVENFDTNSKIHRIYLIAKHDNEPDLIFINCKPNGYKFGEKHAFLSSYSPFEEYVELMAKDMCIALEHPNMSTFKKLNRIENEKEILHIYECLEDSKEYLNEDWKNSASCGDGGWYGYTHKKDLNLIPSEEQILKYI